MSDVEALEERVRQLEDEVADLARRFRSMCEVNNLWDGS